MSLRAEAERLSQRVLNQHLRIGITGLSGAGKTAFITSLLHLLTQQETNLPFFTVRQQGRLQAGHIIDNADLQVARFPFERNLQCLLQGQWPASTTQLSQITLQLKYQPQQGFRRYLAKQQHLTIEIIDYPGEWLLDLPLLQLDYAQWSAQMWTLLLSMQHLPTVSRYIQQVQTANLATNELFIQQCTDFYRAALVELRSYMVMSLQPGRLLRPADLAGSPLLNLFPLPSEAADSSVYPLIAQHYQRYCQQVVQPFCANYINDLDRQVLLVDCLGALNHGYQALHELQSVLLQLGSFFRYGNTNWLQRVFAPKINKVLFVASKADLLTPDQHRNMLLLLQQMLQQPLQAEKYAQCATEVLAVASVVSAQLGHAKTKQGMQVCIQGRLQATGELLTLYPGEVPISMPTETMFAHHQFAFPQFLPLLDTEPLAISQQRMDQVLQFLLGDHLL